MQIMIHRNKLIITDILARSSYQSSSYKSSLKEMANIVASVNNVPQVYVHQNTVVDMFNS